LVTPLLKKPGLDVADYKNFRPITNLTTISKLLERLALARVKSFIVTSPNFCPLQSAYRSSHSTETALIKIMDDILSEIDHGSVVSLVSLDISAAFDTISHKTIIKRLEDEFGIVGTALLWFQSYLSDRTFSVRVGSTSSSAVPVSTGVPQGSVLGPLLFTVYVSPIGRLIESCHIGYHAYADDTQLFTALRTSVQDNIDRLVHCVETLQLWFWHNGLLLNPDKSEVIFFGTRQRLHSTGLPTSISIAGNVIAVSTTLKILGVKLDSTLSFNDHVNDVVRVCNYHMRALRHIRRYMSKDVAKSVAFSIVGSRIDYCNSLLYDMGTGLTNKLQRIQNNLARVVCDVRRGQRSSHDLLQELHWLPIASRIDFKIALLCYKACKLGEPTYLQTLIHPHVPARCLRSSDDRERLAERKSKLDTAARRFSVAAPKLWNSLKQSTRQAATVGAFKSALKTELMSKRIV
jgi:hypothetical protein